VVAELVRMDGALYRVGRLGSEFVLGTETRLGTQAVDLAGIDLLPADVVADLIGSLAAGRPDSLVAVGSGTEVEEGVPGSPGEGFLGILLDILEAAPLDIPETGNRFGALA
jgi:hypothetical protein